MTTFTRVQQVLAPVMRQRPTDATAVSHQMLLKAGYIRQTGAGLYSLLPLGHRCLEKVKSVVRRHMAAVDGQEVTLPALQPAGLWQQSQRWEATGAELIRVKDRRNADLVLAPTAEELITDLVADHVTSHRALPLRLYQITSKFRDEARPRFGLLRAREFLMKDMYTFDVDVTSAMATYNQVRASYRALLDELALPYLEADADTGNIGGSLSHEFQVLASSGEDAVLACDSCSYVANQERADSLPPPGAAAAPGRDVLLRLAETEASLSSSHPAMLRVSLPLQDDTVNPIKVRRVLGLSAEPTVVSEDGDAAASSVSKVFVDAGAADTPQLRTSRAGDRCVAAGCRDGVLVERRGIEVGHSFFLGTKYSKVFQARVSDASNVAHDMQMGCYGIGVSRLMAAAVEAAGDRSEMRLPACIAPYRVAVIVMGKDQALVSEGERLAGLLAASPAVVTDATDILLDASDNRPGAKLGLAEHIGFPWLVLVGRSWRTTGQYEVVRRGFLAEADARYNVCIDGLLSLLSSSSSSLSSPP